MWWLGRRGAVHLVESGRHDSRMAIERSLGTNCRALAANALADLPGNPQLEVLWLPAAEGYACCLHARSTTGTHDDTTPTPAPVEPAAGSTAAIARAAEQLLPDFCGVETGDLWLGPLLAGIPITCRAVTTNSDGSISKSTSTTPLDALQRWAQNHERTPLLGQLLIQPTADGDDDVTFRAMQLAAQPPTTRRELGASLATADGVSSPLDALPDEIVSTRQLAGDHWDTAKVLWDTDTIHYPTLGSARLADTYWPARAQVAREALTSAVETQGLVTAKALTGRYESFAASPQLSVDGDDLERLLDVFPLARLSGLRTADWLGTPRFDRETVVREPAGTDPTAILPSPAATGWRHQTEETAPLAAIRTWLAPDNAGPDASTAQLWESRIDQPHLDGTASPLVNGLLVIVDRNAVPGDVPIGTAGGLISVANQAIDQDAPLWVLATDTESGEWATRVLQTPLKKTHATSGQPYIVPRFWVVDVDETVLPLANREQRRNWRVTPAGRWLFHVAGEVRAHGSLDALSAPTELSLPRLVQRDGGFDYVTADGEVRDRVGSVGDLEGPMQPIPQPVILRWPTGAGYARILSGETTSLRPLWTRPLWHKRFRSEYDARYVGAAVRKFVDTLTVERPDTHDAPPARDVWRWFLRYYCSQTDYDILGLGVEDIADLLDVRVRRTDSGRVELPTRSWPYPPRTEPANPHESPYRQ